MVVAGDQLYVGRYLVTGADAASLYLSVQSKTNKEIVCTALNEATLGGLLTIFHMERNEKGIENKQNQQPLFAQSDIDTLQMLMKEFEVDFLSLSYCRTSQARRRCCFLASAAMHARTAHDWMCQQFVSE